MSSGPSAGTAFPDEPLRGESILTPERDAADVQPKEIRSAEELRRIIMDRRERTADGR
jgi:hypothetical protein